jgi:NAD(P)-dependent dehydrogenase (short-subunit alcohol dehydrogenase family)
MELDGKVAIVTGAASGLGKTRCDGLPEAAAESQVGAASTDLARGL